MRTWRRSPPWGVYGTSVLTAITSQNTFGVSEVVEMPLSAVGSQVDATISDIGTDAVKTGMLSSSAIIAVVAEKVQEYGLSTLVGDPVMVAKGGARLLQEQAVVALRDLLIPLALVVTPNGPEAQASTEREASSLDDARIAARELVHLGARMAVVKGGHLEGTTATDVMYDGEEFREFGASRIETTSTHGTGHTFASAIATGLARALPHRTPWVRPRNTSLLQFDLPSRWVEDTAR